MNFIQLFNNLRNIAISIPADSCTKVVQLSRRRLRTQRCNESSYRHRRWTAAQLVGEGSRTERTLGTPGVNHISVYSAAASVPSALLTPRHVNYFVNFPPARPARGRSSVVSTPSPLLLLSFERDKPPPRFVGKL